MLSSEVAIQVCNADSRVTSEFSVEVVDNNRRDYCLARSRYAWAEESLLALVEPLIEFLRI